MELFKNGTALLLINGSSTVIPLRELEELVNEQTCILPDFPDCLAIKLVLIDGDHRQRAAWIMREDAEAIASKCSELSDQRNGQE